MSVRDLLAQAEDSPRPWKTGADLDWHIYGADGCAVVGDDGTDSASAALIVQAVNEYECLLDIADAAEQIVRRDISIEVVALCEANLIAALARLSVVRGTGEQERTDAS